MKMQCYLCTQRNNHTSAECPNVTQNLTFHNDKWKQYRAENEQEDESNKNILYQLL